MDSGLGEAGGRSGGTQKVFPAGGDVDPHWKAELSRLPSHILKSSSVISCLGLRDNRYSTNGQIGLKSLQSGVTEKTSASAEVTYVSSF